MSDEEENIKRLQELRANAASEVVKQEAAVQKALADTNTSLREMLRLEAKGKQAKQALADASRRLNDAQNNQRTVFEEDKKKMRSLNGELGSLSYRLRGAKEDTSDLAKSFMDLGLSGAGLVATFKSIEYVDKYYKSYIMPIDEENKKIAESFGRLPEGLIESGATLREQILGLATDLDGKVSPALSFLSPGFKGAEEEAKTFGEALVGLGGRFDALTLPLEKQRLNFAVLGKILATSSEDVNVFADRSIVMGTTIQQQMAASAMATQKFSKAFNVNQKQLAISMNALRKDFVNFATFSEEELAKVAATANKLGVSLEGIKKLNMFDNFDQTAQKAAMLGQAFGINVDAFELFAAENPADRLRILQQAALDAGQDVTQLGRIGLNYFADLTGGMNPQDVLKAFSPGNIGRFEQGISATAGQQAGDMQAQMAQMNELNLQMRESADRFFKEYGDMIPAAVTDFRQKSQAIVDAMFAGGTRPDVIREQAAEPLARSLGQIARTFGGLPAGNKMMDNLLMQVLGPLKAQIKGIGDIQGETRELFTAQAALAKAEEAYRKDQSDQNTAALNKATKDRLTARNAFEAEMRRVTAMNTSETMKLIDSFSAGILNTGTGAADRSGSDAVRKSLSTAEKFFDKIAPGFLKGAEQMFKDITPKLIKAIKEAAGDFIAVGDLGVSTSGGLTTASGGNMEVSVRSGRDRKTFSLDPRDEVLAGPTSVIAAKPGGPIDALIQGSRELVATAGSLANQQAVSVNLDVGESSARALEASVPMGVTAGKLLPEISRLQNDDGTVIVNLHLDMPVDFNNTRTAAAITKAALSGQVTPGGASFKQILQRPTSEGVDFGAG